MKRKVLVLNGSPSGAKGNCAELIREIKTKIDAKLEVLHLANEKFDAAFKKKMSEASAVIFVTGTYWDSWGSPLQRFLEDMTEMEASPAIMGKPCAVFVLMHSVGGKSVLSRLQGVLSTMGFLIPPMSGMVYSLVSDIALKSKTSHAKDFWQLEDADLILENLIKASELEIQWATWPVDKKDPRRKWLKT